MTSHRYQHNFTFSTIKNGNKGHICYSFLFCFHEKKSAADAHRIIYETRSENVIAIRMCANLL